MKTPRNGIMKRSKRRDDFSHDKARRLKLFHLAQRSRDQRDKPENAGHMARRRRLMKLRDQLKKEQG